MFAELHLAMLAAGLGDRTRLDASTARLRKAADKGHAAAPVASAWSAALGALPGGDATAARSGLRTCQEASVRLGRRHAQRDVVGLTSAWVDDACRSEASRGRS